MVQVLPYVPSFGERLLPALAEAGSNVAQGLQRKHAATSLQRALASIEAPTAVPGSPVENVIQGVEQSSRFNPSNLFSIYPVAEKALGPDAAKQLLQLYAQKSKLQEQEGQKIRLQERKFQQQQAQKAEPDLLERETKLMHYEQEGARFERLQNLFSPELESKFPSSFSVGLLTKEGELRPTAAALLSPEAQEAVKLIADNLSGAKDTFGARVTNFDLQSYMKRLPSLLNSPEGRRRVLRDLRLMNKLNTMHEQGVLDIIEKEGGPEKISISQAERKWKKEHSKQLAEIKKEFVNPEKNTFNDKPDASLYQGRIIVDEETGERFRSNGKEWIAE